MAKPNRPDYFDQDDEPDDQHGTIADAADKESEDYAPALVPKSAFMGKTYEVGDMVRMRVQAIHDDEVELVCEPKGESETTDESDDEAEPTAEAEGEAEPETAEVVAPDSGGSSAAMFD